MNLIGDGKSSSLIGKKNKGRSTERSGYLSMISVVHPSVTSRREYLANKMQKATNVINVKPENAGMIDRRIQESTFQEETDLNRSKQIANNSKAMRLNRRQMFKNAPLEDSYEPVITTKQVESPLAPEVDLPALKQSFRNSMGRNRRLDQPLNLISHQPKPLY